MLMNILALAILSIVSATKRGVLDAVPRVCNAHDATFVIDGISRYTRQFLKNCPESLKVTFLVGEEELGNKDCNRTITVAIENGHTVAFRFKHDYDRKFQRTNPSKLVDRLDEVSPAFLELYNYRLEHVFFPPALDPLTAHVEAVQDAHYSVIGNSLFVDRSFKATSRSRVNKQLTRHSANKYGPIIYMSGYNSRLMEDIDATCKLLLENNFDVVTLSECLNDNDL